MVILEVIIVNGALIPSWVQEIGVNPHGEFILTILFVTNITVDGTNDLFDLQVVIFKVILCQCGVILGF